MSPALRYETLMERAPATPGGFTLMCVLCGDPSPDEAAHRCPTCDGAIDAVHDLASVSTAESPPKKGENPLQRYFDLLPVRDRNSLKWLGEGNTPCFTAEKLGERIGMSRIILKNESENPTRSTKDRIASVGLSRLAELGVRRFVMASTGNSSTAYAHGVQSLEGVELALFCGRRFRHRLNYTDHPSVTTYLVDGDFVEAGRAARRFALRTGAFTEGGFFNVARREGLKLAYLEAFDQMDAEPDHVFQAVSSGMGLLGAYKGALEYRLLGRLSRVPRFTAVQQAGCAPMARAYAEGAESIAPRHIVRDPQGPAEAILRGDPTRTYPYIREVCRSSGGRITSVSEAEINAARDLLEETEGLRVCHASATALAGAVKMRREGEIAADDVVLVNLTGGDRTGWATPERVRNVPADWPRGPVSWEDVPAPATAASAASFSRATAFGKPPRAYFDLNHAGLRELHRIGAQGAPGFHPCPTLLWARDPDRLDADLARARQWGYAAEEVAPEAPAVPRGVDRAALSPRVVRLPDEGWVDLPAMAGWMVDRARREGAEVRFGARVERILTDAAGAVCGVALADGGRVDAGTVVNAAGAGAEEVAGLVGGPLALAPTPGLLADLPLPGGVDAMLLGPDVSVRPAGPDGVRVRSDGVDARLAGPSGEPLDSPVRDLIERAGRVLPALRGTRPTAVRVGIRAFPADGGSSVGFLDAVPGYYEAVTHSGATLGALLGRLVADEISSGRRPDLLTPFSPDRFHSMATP